MKRPQRSERRSDVSFDEWIEESFDVEVSGSERFPGLWYSPNKALQPTPESDLAAFGGLLPSRRG